MASRLAFVEALGRKVRMDDPTELGVPTQNLIEEALAAGRPDEALEWLDYLVQEFKILSDSVLTGWLQDVVEYTVETAKAHAFATTLRVPRYTTYESLFRLAMEAKDEVRVAIQNGQYDLAKVHLEYMRKSCKRLNDLCVNWIQDMCTFLGQHVGEEEVLSCLRVSYDRIWSKRYKVWDKLTPHEQLALSAEGMRTHFGGPTRRGEFEVREEADRYVMSFSPCGTGGVIRGGDPEEGTGPWPTEGVNRQPHDWCWGKTDVHWYCAHCNAYLESFAAQDWGYPIRPLEFNSDPYQPCKWLVYKDPKRMRAHHFTRIGMEPPPGAPEGE